MFQLFRNNHTVDFMQCNFAIGGNRSQRLIEFMHQCCNRMHCHLMPTHRIRIVTALPQPALYCLMLGHVIGYFCQ
ncbi:hypothetical protein GALL_444170 [mine drainage metagenome]|uniref:Uncharacterized protein n=1 Tax=mine drainage metagenome TaxID=410659 RepID=A0A1J5Q1Q7_9ZZZZ